MHVKTAKNVMLEERSKCQCGCIKFDKGVKKRMTHKVRKLVQTRA